VRVSVDLNLDWQQQFRDALDLVNDHHARVIDESNGVGDCRLPDKRQVQITPFCFIAAGELVRR
jgi:hypothetical protein